MPWKEETIMSQKEAFIKEALRKTLPFSQLCQAYGISRSVGYVLLERYQRYGMKGLEAQSKAPHTSPEKTSEEVEAQIIKLRQEKPTWGGRKIYTALEKRGVKNIPAISTINGILKRRGYITQEESEKRQPYIRFEREAANDLWQMDFKGWFTLGINERCYPLTILDDHSRFSLCLQACANEKRMTVQQQLIQVFEQYGLPLQINVDNGNPWGNSSGHRYTQLTVWMMQLGITVTHSRYGHPQTNGKLERFHRTLKNDVLKRQTLYDFAHAQQIFDEWRYCYNHERPHEAIGMSAPAERYIYSARVMPNKLPTGNYEEGAIVRKVRTNGYVSFNSQEYFAGEAFSGYFIEVRPSPLNNTITLYFNRHMLYSYPVK